MLQTKPLRSIVNRLLQSWHCYTNGGAIILLRDYLVTLGLDGLKEFISDQYNEHQMAEAIREYVERQRDINFTCTREEEIDFGGVVEYLCSSFHDDIEQRLTGETSEIYDLPPDPCASFRVS